MSSSTGSVDEKIQMLPPDLREEAIHYIDQLVRRSRKAPPTGFRCVAEGTLAELGKRYSSVELQHKASDWREAWMYLLDTNIFLEYIIRWSRVSEVRDFFRRADISALNISDFSLHTIGVIYLREHRSREFLTFVNEDIIASGIRVISLTADNFSKITEAADRFHLDFDDAYQYAAAELHELSIVSFDKDFDRTEKGRIEPQDLFRWW